MVMYVVATEKIKLVKFTLSECAWYIDFYVHNMQFCHLSSKTLVNTFNLNEFTMFNIQFRYSVERKNRMSDYKLLYLRR